MLQVRAVDTLGPALRTGGSKSTSRRKQMQSNEAGSAEHILTGLVSTYPYRQSHPRRAANPSEIGLESRGSPVYLRISKYIICVVSRNDAKRAGSRAPSSSRSL